MLFSKRSPSHAVLAPGPVWHVIYVMLVAFALSRQPGVFRHRLVLQVVGVVTGLALIWNSWQVVIHWLAIAFGVSTVFWNLGALILRLLLDFLLDLLALCVGYWCVLNNLHLVLIVNVICGSYRTRAY